MICKWANDSQHLILEYFDVISNSPSEIYNCALPFSPSSSWLRECYSPELLQRVRVVKGLQAKWETCSRTVSLYHCLWTLACWKDIVAVGLESGDITVLDVITGICTSALSSHTKAVHSLAFSLDGRFLVSGSTDETVILWDIQTGGAIKTFCGHTSLVSSVSISLDCTTIASGSFDNTICLWDAQGGECSCVIHGHNDTVSSVSFSTTNSQLLVSASRDGTIQQWDIDGHKIGSAYEGNHVVFSSDGICFVSWKRTGRVATVRNFSSGEVIAELESPSGNFWCCCISPDGKFVAGNAHHTIYIWNITGLAPYLVETLTGHTGAITSLVFSSSLISSSIDRSVKFWEIDASPVDPVTADSEPTPLTSAKIMSVGLQTTNGIAISSDEVGVVKTWDISTGLCKASFQTPAKVHTYRDAQIIGGRLTFVWLEDRDEKIHVWDLEKGESLQILDMQLIHWPKDFRISGDGSKVFLLYEESIQALSIWTGQVVGEVAFEGKPLDDSLITDGSRVWVCFRDLQPQGWDFGFPDSSPVPLPNSPQDRPHLLFIGTWSQGISPSRVEDRITRKEVLQLPRRYARPYVAQLYGQYLVTGYDSGEVLILDLSHIISQQSLRCVYL